ncbi:phospholipase D [Tieghemostelium lacteum]|uniref:Phospholipase D n=1 Tax=Tieghemostelium lacteum TaxID=361077 RepID=A0A152A1W4_TIELA|nr:phospholipase D [Tieghemostelium lacteum]|eukprot:KYR00216.1 phospholipase D [Tieghemostelium lacteum]
MKIPWFTYSDDTGKYAVILENILIVMLLALIPSFFLSFFSLMGSIISIIIILIGFMGAYHRKRHILSFYIVIMIINCMWSGFCISISIISILKGTPELLQFMFTNQKLPWLITEIVSSSIWLILAIVTIVICLKMKRLLDIYHYVKLFSDHPSFIHSQSSINQNQPIVYQAIPYYQSSPFQQQQQQQRIPPQNKSCINYQIPSSHFSTFYQPLPKSSTTLLQNPNTHSY